MKHVLFHAVAAGATAMACGSGSSGGPASENNPASPNTATVDSACKAAHDHAYQCEKGDGNTEQEAKKVGESACEEARCAWLVFRDAASISEKLATSPCGTSTTDVVKLSAQAHASDPGVTEFLDACTPKTRSCDSEIRNSCAIFAALNDRDRGRFSRCLQEDGCQAVATCRNAIFAMCDRTHWW